MTNEREIILSSLIEILENGAYSHVVERSVLAKYDHLGSNRKAFIRRVTDGTVEKLIILDEVIDRYAKTKVSKQKPVIRNILRMSTYQLLYMDHVYASAAVNEAVKLAKSHGFAGLSGFVNGVLRSIARERDAILAENLSGLPAWMREHFVRSYGEEKASLIAADADREHPVILRYRGKDPEAPEKQGLRKYPSEELPDAYILPKGISPAELPGFTEGDYIVQDAASQIAVRRALIRPGDLVVDLCAAPGGKSILACDLGAKVIARDIGAVKTALLRDTVDRCGAGSSVRIEDFDATGTDESLVEKADAVLADLPCSGLGVIGRKADIRHKTKQEDIPALQDLQRRILGASWKYVKHGGILLYSTCTLNPGENEEQARFLTESFPFELLDEHTFLPGLEPTDGFYYAKLRRM